MDGRLVIEEGDVYELIALAKTNTRPEVVHPRRLGPARRPQRHPRAGAARRRPQGGARQRRAPLRPRRAALPALPRRRHAVLLRLLRAPRHDARPGPARQEAPDRRQAPRPPRRARPRHRLRLGRHGALPRPRLRRRRHRHHPQPGAAPRRHRARRRRRPRRPGALPPAGLPRGRGTASTTSSRSACSSTSACRSSRPSSAPSAASSPPTASCCCTPWRSPTAAPYNQPFIDKYIFPGGYIPALSEVFPAVEKAGPPGPRHRDPVAALRRDHPGMAPPLPRQPRGGARPLRRALHPHVGILPRRLRERLPPRRTSTSSTCSSPSTRPACR